MAISYGMKAVSDSVNKLPSRDSASSSSTQQDDVKGKKQGLTQDDMKTCMEATKLRGKVRIILRSFISKKQIITINFNQF